MHTKHMIITNIITLYGMVMYIKNRTEPKIKFMGLYPIQAHARDIGY
jgi:hypothetical protein